MKKARASSQTSAALSTLANVWAAVDIARANYAVTTERPANSFTLAEYCSNYNIRRQTAQSQIRTMLDDGMLSVTKVLLPDAGGKFRQQNVYTPVHK